MMNIIQSHVIINDEDEAQVLTNNPTATVTPAVPGEGVTFNTFAGWTATNFVRIIPFSPDIKLADIRKIAKTHVKANDTVYTAASPNYGVITNGSTHVAGIRESTIQEARRESNQIATLLINAAPAVGTQISINIRWYDEDNITHTQNFGTDTTTLSLVIPSTVTTAALLAAYIKAYLDERKRLGQYLPFTTTVSGATLTFTGIKIGRRFNFYFKDMLIDEVFDLNATFTITKPAWNGTLNYYSLVRNRQRNDFEAPLMDPEYSYYNIPQRGAYYTSYRVVYERKGSAYKGYGTQQQSAIDVENTHVHEFTLFVNNKCTNLITQLDLML